jgi:hypothetical protein
MSATAPIHAVIGNSRIMVATRWATLAGSRRLAEAGVDGDVVYSVATSAVYMASE